MKEKTPGEKLLDAMFSGMTEEESKYLVYLLPRVGKKYTAEKARELFLKKFPNTKWMQH